MSRASVAVTHAMPEPPPPPAPVPVPKSSGRKPRPVVADSEKE